MTISTKVLLIIIVTVLTIITVLSNKFDPSSHPELNSSVENVNSFGVLRARTRDFSGASGPRFVSSRLGGGVVSNQDWFKFSRLHATGGQALVKVEEGDDQAHVARSGANGLLIIIGNILVSGNTIITFNFASAQYVQGNRLPQFAEINHSHIREATPGRQILQVSISQRQQRANEISMRAFYTEA
ncbi:hypothetical protein AK812_SmicGene34144 [Symbiodinium microadriaticum]|uniref:Uncharacterized protein n=1 Tax=Symbiodinium microadriaticum TaxID=2951 RepID=A0A1Q9CPV7_SYMMI|nr:hypothetical protein AK812_SmicGene34144 [Symbiodinium microadriaticum]